MATIHIYRANGQGFLPRVRMYGQKNYTVAGKPRKTLQAAMIALAKLMATGKYKRGDILLTADWYEPRMLYEVVQQ